MESTIPTQTLSDDLVHQQHPLKVAVNLSTHKDTDMVIKTTKEAVNLVTHKDTDMVIKSVKEAVNFGIQEETDMVIVSRDKKLIPCHRSVLALFSPVLGRLMSEVPCCSSLTIFLPDFPALYINKLLQLLRSGQAIHGENVNIDVKMIKKIAEVLQISITDLNLRPWLDNPLGVPFEIKKELSSVKKQINSFERKKEVILKQESEIYNEELEGQPVSDMSEEKEEYEYIEQDEDIDDIVLAAEQDPKLTEEIMESSNDMVIREAADVVFEDEQMSHDWYEAEESENMIPNEEQGLADQTKSSEDTDFQLRMHKNSQMDEKQFPHPVHSKMSTQMGSSNKLKRIHTEEEQLKRNPTLDKPDQGLFSSKKNPLRKNLNQDKMIPTQEELYKCVLCSKSFSRLDHLKEHNMIHKRTHTGEKLHQCDVCSKSFSKLGSLKVHKMTHTGKKSHQCEQCTKSFSKICDFKRHKIIHTGEKPYQCVQCPQSFNLLKNLKRHNTIVHTRKKPHQCVLCPKSFSQLIQLKSHNMMHGGEKPHQCVQCPKAFSQLSRLKRHEISHTGEKPHQCVVCSRKFSRLDTLKAHKMKNNCV